jgi:hypothetical protein
VSIRSFSVTKGENIVTRTVLVTISIAGILLSAVVGATERWGTSSGDLETPSSPVIAAPFVAADAGKADAPPGQALPQAWVFVAERLPTSFAGRLPKSP